MASMEKINEQAAAFFEELENMDEWDELDASEESKDRFRIENDSAAEWALEKIRDITDEYNRLKKLILVKRMELADQEDKLNARMEGQTRYLNGLLEQYFRDGDLKTKETKTQKSYKLLSGTLVLKKESYGYLRDENALIQWAHNAGRENYVETIERLKWADLKRQLVFDNDTVYDPDTGAIVDGITAVRQPEKFEVKLG